MRYSVVDIGSNTLKMNIYDAEVSAAPALSLVLSESATIGLISYKNGALMGDGGIVKLVETLEAFKKLSDNVGSNVFMCYATASLRFIDNSDEVIRIVRDRTGIAIDLISGENEALFGFDGLRWGLGQDVRCGVMADLGGGSTELVGFIDGMAVRAISLSVGCLTLYKKYVGEILPKKQEIKEIRVSVDKSLADIDWLGGYGDTAYLVGGTARALGRLHAQLYPNDRPERGYQMSAEEVGEVAHRLREPGKKEAELLIRTVPDRLHTIIPGITVYRRIIKKMGAEKIVISNGGLREGYLLSRLKNLSAKEDNAE
ncbi:MAG: hypothetical protein WCQ72_00805 [Eubacteriales bacterium]